MSDFTDVPSLFIDRILKRFTSYLIFTKNPDAMAACLCACLVDTTKYRRWMERSLFKFSVNMQQVLYWARLFTEYQKCLP